MWRAIYHEFRRWAKVSRSAWTAWRRTEITVETDRIWIIRTSRSTPFRCAQCGRELESAGLEQAAAVTGVSQPLLAETHYEPTQHKKIHMEKEKENEKR